MEESTNHLNENKMSKKMNWDAFVPTRGIKEFEMRLRESVKQREQLKRELAELEKKPRDMFWEVEYSMLSTGIRYFNTCAEFYMCKAEYEYIMAEIAAEETESRQ